MGDEDGLWRGKREKKGNVLNLIEGVVLLLLFWFLPFICVAWQSSTFSMDVVTFCV